jgi:hypothetical protein
MPHEGPLRFAAFCATGFLAKVASEAVHEALGHGVPVIHFGGEVTEIQISLLWPYELSHVRWAGAFEAWQMPWIHGGGMLACISTFTLLQALARAGDHGRLPSYALFWLSFWTLLNPAGYLVVGGIRPFGDVLALIGCGVLTSSSALVLGVALFLVGFFLISTNLRRIISGEAPVNDRVAWLYIGVFWLLLPLLAAIALLGMGMPLSYALLGFAPAALALAISFLRGPG